ncbi:MAG: tyrosine-type recombinase/integrase [Bdellovibrionales bacterium]
MKEQSLRKYLDQFLELNPSGWEWETKGMTAGCNKKFLRWLESESWTVQDLDAVRMRRFFTHMVHNKVHPHTRWKTRMLVFKFLQWLHSQDYPMRPPEDLLPYQKPRSDLIDVELPAFAVQFLEMMSAKVKKSTLIGYRTACKHFHKFLEDENIELRTINRSHMEKYFKLLVDLRQKPCTRLSNLVVTRVYLNWLKDKKLIKEQPLKIITTQDYPRIPEYLPRPLPPEVDQLIQKRLAESDDRLHKALLLMRWTGVRIGELSRLSFECIHSDIHGHKFLKVPLGKLDNERLVPLDEKAVKLIQVIQRKTRAKFQVDPPHLLSEKTLKPPATHVVMNAFREIYEDIKTDTPIVSHRLRHTYATELLSAGMNICALKEALGHRDIKMTLRYAAVTQEKVRTEYFAALQRMKEGLPKEESLFQVSFGDADYNVIFSDLVLKIKKNGPRRGFSENHLKHLIKRVRRLKDELKRIV